MAELTPVRHATQQILHYYKHLLADHADVPDQFGAYPTLRRAYLAQMVDVAMEHNAHWPIDKTSRWLGFIQAGMVLHGLGTVDAERGHSRHLFHEAYRKEGIDLPPSVSVV